MPFQRAEFSSFCFPHIASGCSSAVVGAAVGSFIGGVLLTAVIAGVIAVAVLNRVKKELSARTG